MSNNPTIFDLVNIRSRNLYLTIGENVNIDDLMSDRNNSNVIQGYSEITNINTFALSEDESKWRYVFIMLLATRVVPSEDIESKSHLAEEYEAPVSINSLVELIYESKNKMEFSNEPAELELYPLKEVWPFWRDLVHATCLRAGYIPSIKIPTSPPDRPVYTNHIFHSQIKF